MFSSGSNDFSIKPITDEQYAFICDLVYKHSRIKLGPNKKELVMARLSKRIRRIGIKTYEEYCTLLKGKQGEDELSEFIDAISTNHTFFFRESAHFDFLKETILPAVAPANGRNSSLKIWSAACSSGEEPYSIALLLSEYYRSNPSARWQVDCTDISTKVLKKASEGIFDSERLKQVPEEMVKRYFQKGFGDWEGFYRARDEIKQHLSFQRLNLLAPSYPFREEYDVIFCRNVMIYFDKATQNELVQKFFPLIRPGGYLFIGHAESLTGTNHNLKMIKPAIYQKI